MNKELYDKLFAQLDSLCAIRKDLSFGCELKIYNPTGMGAYIETSDVGNGFKILEATNGLGDNLFELLS